MIVVVVVGIFEALSEQAQLVAFALLGAVPAIERIRRFGVDAGASAQRQAGRAAQHALAIGAGHRPACDRGAGLAAHAAVLRVDVRIDAAATARTVWILALVRAHAHLALRRRVSGWRARGPALAAIGSVRRRVHAR